MEFKTKEDYIKEIAAKINAAKYFEIQNPTKEDILNLKGFDCIITDGKYFPVIIRNKYTLDSVLGIPTIFWDGGYEIGDSALGILPETFNVDEIMEIIKGYKGEVSDED